MEADCPYSGNPQPNLNAVKNGEFCESCGTELMDKCNVCGAPVCCPKCCRESELELITIQRNGQG